MQRPVDNPVDALVTAGRRVGLIQPIRRQVLGSVQQIPAHMDYLRSYCPAPKP